MKWKWTCWIGPPTGRLGSSKEIQEWNSWMNWAVKSGIWRNALISSVVYERSSVAGLSLNANRGYSLEAKTFLHAPMYDGPEVNVNGLYVGPSSRRNLNWPRRTSGRRSMSLKSVFLVRLRVGFVNTPPRTNWNGPLMEWSRGSRGASNDSCRGWMFESVKISSRSCELSSDELRSRGMGLARALDEEAAINNMNGGQNRSRWKKNSAHPQRTIMSLVRLDPKWWRCHYRVRIAACICSREKNRKDVPWIGNRVSLPI